MAIRRTSLGSSHLTAVFALALAIAGCTGGGEGDSGASTTAGSTSTGSTASTGTGSASMSSTSASTTDDTTTAATSATTAATTSSTTEVSTSASTGESTGALDLPNDRLLCPLDVAANAKVSGTTPLGDFVGNFAWHGWYGGECGGAEIFLHTSLEAFTDALQQEPWESAANGVTLWFGTPEWNPIDWVGTAAITVRVYDGDAQQVAEGVGTATVDMSEFFVLPEPDLDPWPQVVGSFAVDDGGVSLSGDFTAPLCDALVIFCP